MTESTLPETPEPPMQPTGAATSSTSAAAALPAQRRSPLLLLLNLLLMAGLAVLAFLFVQQRSALDTIAGDAYVLQQRGAAIEQQLAAAATARAQLEATLQSVLAAQDDSGEQAAVAALQRELAALQRQLAAGSSAATTDWQLVEARGLLRLALQRAQLAQDVEGSISLYQAALALLRQSADPQLQAARAALQVELDALRTVEQPDIGDLYLQLGEVMQRVDALDIQSTELAPLRFSAPAAVSTPAATGWWEALKQNLSQYFVITRQDAPLLARLGPEQVFMIRQALRLQLESARLALLQQDATLYRTALAAAEDGITQQLQGDDKAAVLTSLQRLRAADITVQLPTLGGTLQMLEQQAAIAVPAPAAGELTP